MSSEVGFLDQRPGGAATYFLEQLTLGKSLSFAPAVRDELLARAHQNTTSVRVRNLPLFAERAPHHALIGAAQGLPVVVLGAGPSLESVLGDLEWARRRAIIIMVNSAGPAMQRAGLRADMLVSVEFRDVRATIETGLACADIGVLSVVSPVAELFAGTALIALDDFLALPGPHMPPKSVIVSSVALSLAMGASRIVLAGVDLCFRDGGPYHACGGMYGQTVRIGANAIDFSPSAIRDEIHARDMAGRFPRQAARVSVPAWRDDGMRASTSDFEEQRRLLEATALVSPAPALFNASVGGSRIPGWHECTLREALADAPEIDRPDFRALVDSAPRIPRSAIDTRQKYIERECEALQELASAYLNAGASSRLRKAQRFAERARGHWLLSFGFALATEKLTAAATSDAQLRALAEGVLNAANECDSPKST